MRCQIRAASDEFVQIGDIFAVSERCDDDTQMRNAFDDFGMPQTACVFVRSSDVDDEHCAPLAIEQAGESDR